MSNLFTSNGYYNYGKNYNYPNNQHHVYQNYYQQGEQGSVTGVTSGTSFFSAGNPNNGVSPTESRILVPVDNVEAGVNEPKFKYWAPDVEGMPFNSDDKSKSHTFLMTKGPVTVESALNSIFNIGDSVRINEYTQTWATGEAMPKWFYGRVYPVIGMKTQNGVMQLLLGDGVNSWIDQTDVTKVFKGTQTMAVNDEVRINEGVHTWATGEAMPKWFYGRVYSVIGMKTQNGVTQLLLGDGVNSWIDQTDVTKVFKGTQTMAVNDEVRVNEGVRTWATGEAMPKWVHGRVYPVMKTRIQNGVMQLLLGNGVNSWINQTDVTRV